MATKSSGERIKVRLDPNGRIVIPAAIRKELGLAPGHSMIALVEGGELHLLTGEASIRRVQAMVRKFVPEGVSLVDELLADRRREVARELREDRARERRAIGRKRK